MPSCSYPIHFFILKMLHFCYTLHFRSHPEDQNLSNDQIFILSHHGPLFIYNNCSKIKSVPICMDSTDHCLSALLSLDALK